MVIEFSGEETFEDDKSSTGLTKILLIGCALLSAFNEFVEFKSVLVAFSLVPKSFINWSPFKLFPVSAVLDEFSSPKELSLFIPGITNLPDSIAGSVVGTTESLLVITGEVGVFKFCSINAAISASDFASSFGAISCASSKILSISIVSTLSSPFLFNLSINSFGGFTFIIL